MTGNLYRGQAGLPFSSSLRIYEPLEAFPPEQQRQLVAEGGKAGSRAAVENAELQASLGRITRSGGDPFPTGRTDLVRMTRVPTGRHAAPQGPEDHDAGRLLYCPSQLVIRAGLAANALMDGVHSPLADLLIPVSQRDKHQARIDRINAGEEAKRVHTRASTWGIPFSWFSLFNESDRKDVVEAEGRILTVRVWTPLTEALDRARFAVAHLALAAPDLDMLDDLTQLTEWLELFHVQSMVELDYGAVADKVYPDESPMDVRLGIECLAEGDMTGAAAAYRRLASRWIPIRQLARAS
ncbi:hypothetical protein [Paenarthrobacter aurescens]|uniref:DUF8083 domain-containing protein n=1 Tax=Paenarthrobacter aurescens TaxID=43663 RepID=A0A4Y3NGU8_PAEAU|nr:hypothetical protein [Paenarthrobacter aurescens]UKA50397.1 hypothetical protein LFT48_02325 [Arthrobacter sp. FW305-123]MDO6145286.1 hypothetical protein [Paenarthrobacter aurescens]MDO6145945.1 hypothetical protein [Paenarthrobacter aurescens]MDO6157189.1 hypothetical protein [Paenarthrobacter aurescens]MDO6161174.1 hypothetical protein [Paenarthrobacter aurescens]